MIPNAHLHYPKKQPIGITDANWGPQDQSHPIPSNSNHSKIELPKSRSVSGHIIFFHGPLHWQSKRQSITALSSAESEIYATCEYTKELLYIKQILNDLFPNHPEFSKIYTIYNDNMGCVQWSHNKTTRSIRHIQLRENHVRENVQNKNVQMKHTEGKTCLSDIFTKETSNTSED